MKHLKKNDPFFVPTLPVKKFKNWRTKSWYLVDDDGIIVAEGLTKGTAEAIETSMNYIDETLTLLHALYSLEEIVGYRQNTDENDQNARDVLVKSQYQMLRDFGIDVEWLGVQNYHENLWNYFDRLLRKKEPS